MIGKLGNVDARTYAVENTTPRRSLPWVPSPTPFTLFNQFARGNVYIYPRTQRAASSWARA